MAVLKRFFFIGFFLGLLLASGVFAEHDVDYEIQGLKIAKTFSNFLNERVNDTFYVSNFNYSNIEIAKESIRDFYSEHNSEIWFNLGSDNSPIEQRKEIPLYSSIIFIDTNGNEVLKYFDNVFSNNLLDISVIQNTEFKSETYFEDTIEMESGEVFIGKIMTWYTGSAKVFEEASADVKDNKIYEEVIGRDILKQGVMRFSSPVYENGKLKGIVVLSLDYRHLQELFKHFEPNNDFPVVSTSYAGNYLLVFDVDGNTIFHPKPNNILGYLEDGQLAGFNEPGFAREGNIFNLYKYKGSFSYNEMAKKVLEDKETFSSSATDVGGRTKVVMSVPILYSNSKTNYADVGVFAGIMMSIQLEQTTPIPEKIFILYSIVIGGIIFLVVLILILIFTRKKVEKKDNSLKEVVFGRINRKFIVILCIILFEIILIGFLLVYYQNQSIGRQFSGAMLETEESFADLEVASIGLLSATLETMSNDESIKDIYIEKDREKLFNYLQPLFSELKNRYQVTHFYFIEPNGSTFLRLHNKNVFGDEVKSDIFLEAKETNLISSGIELGKTAYAIRVVMPYYDGDDLIGYIELAQEIDSFFEIMKRRKGDEFLMVVEKSSLNEEDWIGVRGIKGLRNNWDDFDEHVIVSTTTEKIFPCFSTEGIDSLRKKSSLLKISKIEDEFFACGGFALIDITNEKPEVVFSLINATEDRTLMFNMRIIIVLILVLVFSIFVRVGFYVSRKISKPIAELNIVAQELQKKNFKVRADINTDDELQQLGETLNDAARVLDSMDKEYKQLEKAKTEFLSITSHELRSPMTPMQAQLQMLLGDYYGKLTTKQRSAVEIVFRNTKRLDNIIVDFLEISRIEAARLKFRFVKDNPEKVISRVIKELAGYMPEKKIKIVSEIEKLPIIEHDPGRLSQILRNLINNAIKFSKEKSIIGVRAKLKEGMILFSITDQGIGMDAKSQERIFEPFFQAEQTIYRKHQGTGLGLAIIKGIVESQGGKVWLNSIVGKGTTFYFTLPLEPLKKVKPIKLLFSAQENNIDEIKLLFLEVLGPMGNQEFKLLKDKSQLNKNDLILYVNLLIKKGILNKENGEVFKGKLLGIFGSKENEK
ncbi:HAMP domain-containing protein [Candidatus Pacearchaeota archaeon]|nr:HAMP domain-containing protein [Candidatus Pacearchaeota archaeon]